MEREDAWLVQRARRDDREALDALWRRHRKWVAAVLAVRLPRGADVEDALQETALRLVRGLGDLKRPDGFAGWLRTIAVNVAVTQGRRAEVRGELATLGDEPPARGGGTADELVDLVAGLPVDLREPLVLRALEGLSQRAVAEILDVPETTVETRLARARRELRERLRRMEDTA